MNPDSQDKTADALKAQRFRMLKDIARELSGDVVFPIYFDLSLHVRNLLRNPRISQDELINLLSLEPLVCIKILRLANALGDSAAGKPIADIGSAICRLGPETVRATAQALAADQLLQSRPLVDFGTFARLVWEHSVKTAVAARTIARRLTKLNPEEAMLAGLIHDIGAFYMLYRAAQYPELCLRPDTLNYLIVQWHESIGDSLLAALEVPEHIIRAIRDHDQPRPVVESPRTLADVIFVANLLADGCFEWLRKDLGDQVRRPELADSSYLELMDEIRADYQMLRFSFTEHA